MNENAFFAKYRRHKYSFAIEKIENVAGNKTKIILQPGYAYNDSSEFIIEDSQINHALGQITIVKDWHIFNTMTINQKARYLRHLTGLSQAEFAKTYDISLHTLQGLERRSDVKLKNSTIDSLAQVIKAQYTQQDNTRFNFLESPSDNNEEMVIVYTDKYTKETVEKMLQDKSVMRNDNILMITKRQAQKFFDYYGK